MKYQKQIKISCIVRSATVKKRQHTPAATAGVICQGEVVVGDKGQIQTTKALAKFCAEHHCPPGWVSRLNEIAELLERDDKKIVLSRLKMFKGGGMGSFLDIWPEVAFEHETPEYIEVIWWALIGHWRSQMDRL